MPSLGLWLTGFQVKKKGLLVICPSHGWHHSCRAAWVMAGVHAAMGSFSQWVLHSKILVLCTTSPSQTGFSVSGLGV